MCCRRTGARCRCPLDVAKEHFKIWEDGVPQKIQSVTISKAPITAVLLVEFAATNYNFMYDALNASYAFASNLQPQDWVAVVEFDMKTHILVDFTQDKQAIFGALNTLRVPGFSETNIFDAMFDTLDRLDRIPGHKELVVVASGRDTFSKHYSRQDAEEDQGDAQRDHLHHLHRRSFPGAGGRDVGRQSQHFCRDDGLHPSQEPDEAFAR